ncbi:MAG: alpha/beta hydrolase [Bacteroidetes bacterium]|nr:alpha/beta hydrolase [Bacteroidota bacterium]
MKPATYSYFLKRSTLISIILFSVLNATFSQEKAQTGYAPVNGLKMYYEIHGDGQPLVLIHGSFMTINTAFNALIPALSKHRKVIAVELQGHGRTADTDRPFSFESMADDIAELLKYLKIESADILGYSLGGAVALQAAIRHPEAVKKLIVISAAYKSDGWAPQTRAIFPMIRPEIFEGTPLKKEYDSIAPDPKHWASFVYKLKELEVKPFDFTAENIKAIKSPALIIAADGDGVLPEHSVEMYRLLGGKYMIDFGPTPSTQLALFPGSSHISVMMHPDWLLSMLTPFLDASLKRRP